MVAAAGIVRPHLRGEAVPTNTIATRRRAQAPKARARMADRWLPRYRRAIAKLLRQWVDEVIHYDGSDYAAEFEERWVREMARLQMPLALASAVKAYREAQSEITRTGAKAIDAGLEVTKVVGESEALLARRLWPDIERRIAEVARVNAATTLMQVQSVLKAGRKEGLTPAELKVRLAAKLKPAVKHRAEMIARTETIWNSNEAAMLAYKDEGVQTLEWLVTEDDVTCDLCLPMNGRVVQMGTPFATAGQPAVTMDVEHPPLHHGCRCALLPGAMGDEAAIEVQKPKTPKQ